MKVRRVLALVMAVLMVIGLMPVVAAGDGASTTDVQQGEVTFTKDFVRDENDDPVVENGYYTIKISVSGEPYTVETTPNADVVLVVDNSGSMATSVGEKCTNTNGEYKKVGQFLFWKKWKCDTCGSIYYSGITWDKRPSSCTGEIGVVPRIVAAQNVGKIFAENILATSGNKMSVIGFSHNDENGGIDSSAVHVYHELTADSSIISGKIDGMNADGGTNYTAAFEKAKNELLDSEGKLINADRPAYVIFISDGAPGLYSDEPKHDDHNWNGFAQITALKNAGVKIYTIGIKLDEGASNYMRGIATDTDHYKNVQTTDYESEMKSILAEWAKHINSVPAGKKAKVVDVVNTNDFVVNVDALPKNAKYENSTITWEFDEITEDAQCISFKVKP
ncbi:MAG: vWA domain-containing protein, partial [Candidatus Flemingibacterium sp.]|nr:vWA domain-containing protein [Candidatus Flemingibacterium sp.]